MPLWKLVGMEHPLRKYRLESGRTLEEIGNLVGAGRSAVCKWERRGIPAERVLEVERVTGIARHELRPDLYPQEPLTASGPAT